MTVKELIEDLQKRDPEERVISLLYVKEDFSENPIAQEHWDEMSPILEDKFPHDETFATFDVLIDIFYERYFEGEGK